MFVQTLALAVAAASVAPFTLAQSADAPAMASESELYAACVQKIELKGGSHSLLDIVGGQFTDVANGGEESVMLPLVDAVSNETLAILDGFDVAGQDYTLLMPLNKDKMGLDLTESFDLNSTAFIAAADDIIMAHILPGTIDYATLQEKTNDTGMWEIESLQGFMWTFGWSSQAKGGFPYLVDEWNITKEGEIELLMDINNEPDCPNRVIGVKGFVVSPDLLTPAEPPMSTAAPAVPRSIPSDPETAPTTPTTSTATPATPPTPAAAGGLATSSLAALSVLGAVVLGAALL